MLKSILFDLDDTLLGNSVETFIPAYFQMLTRYMAHLIPPERLISELMRATQAMETNDGTGLTNEEKFASVFYPALGYEPAELKPTLEQFYAEEFPKLRPMTQLRPEARPLVEWAFEHGLQVAIATNPLFPRSPIEQRLEWAGVPVTEFDYALVTTYEDMHATKSHPAYYHEILNRLDRQPGECLMVGDNWEWDIAPATSIGISAYWIADPDDASPALPTHRGDKRGVLAGQGRLADLLDLCKQPRTHFSLGANST
ncbi:MAG: HAD family hydrolase [Chloroflexota bacterium]|nr:HAD family hydrolase [Chloroflexota bacterium]